MLFKSGFIKIILSGILLVNVSCTKDPEACFVSDKGKAAKVNEEVHFNAACSTDADSYAWDFGDGTSATGATTKHKFSRAATYMVKLTVSNKNKDAMIIQDLVISQ